ncbi:unnamed protein product [Lepeophtheirus salmonis]|uniref:(salmon louse) hypothetical protein n=1 Tax=Lepeophtheirus salmonis TaxID=72036 RepID=A0A7R8D3E1_LEPSM|nr:unnamed protein product [Lepeophtheirus salmonis]CAF3015838.1 unnamed protein product [Lepeophtheirus salmonis]
MMFFLQEAFDAGYEVGFKSYRLKSFIKSFVSVIYGIYQEGTLSFQSEEDKETMSMFHREGKRIYEIATEDELRNIKDNFMLNRVISNLNLEKKEALNNDDLEQLEISQTSSIQETTNFYEITEDGTSHGDVTNGSIDKESYKKEVIDREPEELVELKTRLRDLELEIQSRNRAWLDVQEEIKDLKAENEELSKSHEDYKLKAQKILSGKRQIYNGAQKRKRREKKMTLIKEIKEMRVSRSLCPLQFVERKEIIYITSERDLIREEANRLANRLKTTLMEVNDLENRVDKQNTLYEKTSDEYQKKISIEKEKTKEAELELKKKLEDIHFLEEAYRREEASYLQSIKLRDLEIENMRKKIMRGGSASWKAYAK